MVVSSLRYGRLFHWRIVSETTCQQSCHRHRAHRSWVRRYVKSWRDNAGYVCFFSVATRPPPRCLSMSILSIPQHVSNAAACISFYNNISGTLLQLHALVSRSTVPSRCALSSLVSTRSACLTDLFSLTVAACRRPGLRSSAYVNIHQISTANCLPANNDCRILAIMHETHYRKNCSTLTSHNKKINNNRETFFKQSFLFSICHISFSIISSFPTFPSEIRPGQDFGLFETATYYLTWQCKLCNLEFYCSVHPTATRGDKSYWRMRGRKA